MNKVAVHIDDICFSYESEMVLKHLTMDIALGSICFVMGNNGSGKTTLLKNIMGFLSPQQGDVQILGESVSNLDNRTMSRLVSYVPQAIHLNTDFSVIDYISLGRTPYIGMPGGVAIYQLWVKQEPIEENFSVVNSIDSTGPYAYHFEIEENVTRVWLKVHAVGFPDTLSGGRLVSQSNIVAVERLTVDSAAFIHITSADYDSLTTSIQLSFDSDTSYHTDHYTLWRSIDNSPWRAIATLPFPLDTYVDYDINPFDSLYCYRLSVTDACDMNEKYSSTLCVVTPDPMPPAAAIPNIIIVGDPDNNTFLPQFRGLKGDLFEMHIYNRQGILVYSTANPAEGWLPTTSTPQGVYTYAIRCHYNNNIIKTHTGTVLVIK